MLAQFNGFVNLTGSVVNLSSDIITNHVDYTAHILQANLEDNVSSSTSSEFKIVINTFLENKLRKEITNESKPLADLLQSKACYVCGVPKILTTENGKQLYILAEQISFFDLTLKAKDCIATICLVGRLGQDPLLKQVGDKTVVDLSVAINDRKKETSWFPIAFWGKTAQTIAKYFNKGSMIGISGKILIREYQDNSGETKKAINVLGNNFTFISKNNGNTNQQVADTFSMDVATQTNVLPPINPGELKTIPF